jgi:hypothetical protein
MRKKTPIIPHSDEQQKEYERSARLQYGPTNVNESIKRWSGYTQAERDQIMAEAGQIYNDLADALDAGKSSQSTEVQAIFARWHENLQNFYEPTLEILRGLGELYNTDPAFMATFQKFHTDLSGYLQEGIKFYVDELEDEMIRRMIAEDDENQARNSG